MKRLSLYQILFMTALSSAGIDTANAVTPPSPAIPPSVANVAYGPDQRQKFDVYLPKGTGPFPVLLWIHGGGWLGGDKKELPPKPDSYLQAGCAIVSINYRLIGDAVKQNIAPPISAVLGDNRRALQFVRLHTTDWHLDPDKIVVGGGSAGAASALYLGTEGEKADPTSSDPVEKVSTKVLGVAAVASQASLDPQRIREWSPGVAWGYVGFEPGDLKAGNQVAFAQFLADRDKWMPEIANYSPDILLTKDAPPIYFFNTQPLPPSNNNLPSGALVHAPTWGIGFQKLAQEKGVECTLEYPGHPPEKYGNLTAFVLHQLGLDSK